MRPHAATAVAWLSVLGVVGAFVMTVAHLGLDISLLAGLGPGRLLLPVAIGFLVLTILYAVVAAGAFRVARWAWWGGIVVHGLAFLGAVGGPAGGWVTVAAMIVSGLAVLILVLPAGRRAFRGASTPVSG